MKKILRRIYYGTHETGDDIRYRYVDVNGKMSVAEKEPSVKELKYADELPPIDHSLSTRWRKKRKRSALELLAAVGDCLNHNGNGGKG